MNIRVVVTVNGLAQPTHAVKRERGRRVVDMMVVGMLSRGVHSLYIAVGGRVCYRICFQGVAVWGWIDTEIETHYCRAGGNPREEQRL